MIQRELLSVLKSRKCIVIITILLFVPCIDLFMNWHMCFWDFITHRDVYPPSLPLDYIFHPSYAAFLSSASLGHIGQMIYIWILPLYLLILYGDSYVNERKVGYNTILFSKRKKNSVLRAKFLASFLISFSVIFLSQIANFLLSNIIFRSGTSFGGLEMYKDEMHQLFKFSLDHPTAVYLLYILVFSIVAGLCGMMCVGLSFLIPNSKFIYPVAFFIWLIQIVMPTSITYVIQPFIEYGFSYILPSIFIYISVVFLIVLASILYKVKTDEI